MVNLKNMRNSKIFVIGALVVSLFTQSCATLGGKEITDAQINAEAAKAYEEVKAKNKRSTNAEWTAMVNRVSDRIAKASGEPYQWEVVLLDNPEPNAWCMPGGKMAVYTGIMPVLKTEGALAAVMGHEVAHATLKHGKQSYSRSIRENTAGLLIGAATIVGGQLLCKDSTCKTLTALGGAAAGFAVTFFGLKYSRSNESEADERGQLYMARAGYDPSESIKLWERMGASGGKKPPEFMSTHPSDETRRGNLDKWMPGAVAEYNKSPVKYGIGDPIR